MFSQQENAMVWSYTKNRRVLGLVNVEPSRLVVVSPEGDLGKHGMR